MKALSFLNKYIIGQRGIKPLCINLMNELLINNLNILIRGSSGYGKTRLAHAMARFIEISKKEKYFYYIGDDIEIDTKRRIHLVDEVHLLKYPEKLYSFMDSGRYSFILCTNYYDTLKEPLVNRCNIINMEEYSNEDIIDLVRYKFKNKNIKIADDFVEIISRYTKPIPRDVCNLCDRLAFIFTYEHMPENTKELKELLVNIFNISEGGFSKTDKKYLDLLDNFEYLSLDSIANILSIPRDTIRREIEPFLLKKGLIEITSKGRKKR